jgi:hypothetical protein
VLEGKLALARQLALGSQSQDVLLLQRQQRPLELALVGARQRGQRALPERAPHHRGLLHQLTLERRQRVEPRGEHRLDRLGQLAGVRAAALGDAPGHLLGEQGVAPGALHHRLGDGLAGGQQRRDEELGLGGGERLQHQLGRGTTPTAPARPAVEQLVAGQADQHQRCAHPLGEVLDRVEHAVVGPVDVLERQHQRPPAGQCLDARAQRREERLAQALRVLACRHQVGGHLEADQAGDQRGLALGLLGHRRSLGAEQVERVVAQLRPRLLGGVGVDDAAFLAQHLAERPEHDAAPVGQAAAGAEGRGDGPRSQLALQLAQDARLAHAGLSDQRHQVRRALQLDPLEDRLESGQLLLAAHQRGLARRRAAADRVLRHHRDGLPRRDGLGLALQLERLELLVLDRAARRAHGALADGDAPRPSRALQPGGDVDHVSHHGVVLADRAGEHLPGVHAHAQVEVHAIGQVLVHVPHRGLHAEPGAHRALLVVLVGDRRAEDRHDVVAYVLVDGPAVALDLRSEPHQHAVDERLHGLGVHALRHGGVAGQVGEQDGHLAALLG